MSATDTRRLAEEFAGYARTGLAAAGLGTAEIHVDLDGDAAAVSFFDVIASLDAEGWTVEAVASDMTSTKLLSRLPWGAGADAAKVGVLHVVAGRIGRAIDGAAIEASFGPQGRAA
jgi:hypothetical protein